MFSVIIFFWTGFPLLTAFQGNCKRVNFFEHCRHINIRVIPSLIISLFRYYGIVSLAIVIIWVM